MKRILSLLIALILPCCTALAETASDPIVATVNGEDLLFSEYYSIETAYLAQAQAAGADLTNGSTLAYFQDLALTYAIEQMLVNQDMHAQGCYEFDDQTEAWFATEGKAAYEKALQDVMESMRTTETSEDELRVNALAYAKLLNVTEETYVDFYRTQYASAKYYEWLIRENPVTDADVQSAYDARVAQSRTQYEHNVAAFETALSNGSEIWYKPAGYRSILQILLPAQGATPEARLQSVQATIDQINARLNQRDSFQSLIAEYGTDASFEDEAFMKAGYQVHQESIIWDPAFINAAFSAEMEQPGCVSLPFVSDLGVHILYYLCDSISGPIELTEAVHTALASVIYTERYTAARADRIDELATAAQIVLH